MTIETDLTLLYSKAKAVTESTSEENEKAVRNALSHLLNALAYTGSAFNGAIPKMVNSLGLYLGYIDSTAGVALSDFAKTAFSSVEGEAVIQFLKEQGIDLSNYPEDKSIYEQFRSGHINENEIIQWLIG